ncbi:hypothetical protein BrL25_05460 [Brevibacillus laterosporus DSM 25]|nr:hypothetical protein BrL25_05460 [Brevibacillus laterosporus DSM 25]
MENVIVKSVANNKAIIEVDLSQDLGVSGSGKNILIAKTGSNMPIGAGGVKINLNVYKALPKSAEEPAIDFKGAKAEIGFAGGTAKVAGSKLTIAVDLTSDLGESGSGKNILIAKTGSNLPLFKTIKMNLNVYKPVPKTPAQAPIDLSKSDKPEQMTLV